MMEKYSFSSSFSLFLSLSRIFNHSFSGPIHSETLKAVVTDSASTFDLADAAVVAVSAVADAAVVVAAVVVAVVVVVDNHSKNQT